MLLFHMANRRPLQVGDGGGLGGASVLPSSDTSSTSSAGQRCSK
jgi:hypothetical protein